MYKILFTKYNHKTKSQKKIKIKNFGKEHPHLPQNVGGTPPTLRRTKTRERETGKNHGRNVRIAHVPTGRNERQQNGRTKERNKGTARKTATPNTHENNHNKNV